MSNSKENLSTAVSDIALIRQTMERSGAHLDKLSSLLILYGIGNPIINIASWLVILIATKTGEYRLGARVVMGFNYLGLAFLLAMCVFFMKKRGEIKSSGGGYSLRLFDLWGVILLLVPLANRIINYVFSTFNTAYDPGSDLSFLSSIVSSTMGYAMLMVAIMFTGLMLGRKWLIWTGTGLLIAFPVLFMFGRGAGYFTRDTVLVEGFFTERIIVISIIIPLICLAAGLYFRRIRPRITEE